MPVCVPAGSGKVFESFALDPAQSLVVHIDQEIRFVLAFRNPDGVSESALSKISFEWLGSTLATCIARTNGDACYFFLAFAGENGCFCTRRKQFAGGWEEFSSFMLARFRGSS